MLIALPVQSRSRSPAHSAPEQLVRSELWLLPALLDLLGRIYFLIHRYGNDGTTEQMYVRVDTMLLVAP